MAGGHRASFQFVVPRKQIRQDTSLRNVQFLMGGKDPPSKILKRGSDLRSRLWGKGSRVQGLGLGLGFWALG